jgi:hypothetical protein
LSSWIRSSKPLNTDSTITKAIVPTATPSIEIMEMMLIKFFFFLDRKYLLAMKYGRFNGDQSSFGGIFRFLKIMSIFWACSAP